MAARSQREKDHMKNKNQVILAEMLKEETNKYCSDCGAKGPRWASWNLGVFLCIRCAGIHRNLGVHISKVKSVNLDSWTPEQMTNIQDWGNRRAGLYWECFLPKDFHRPQTNSAVETFIRNKYEHKKYVKKDGIPPKPASNAAPSSSDNKPEKVTKKKKDDQSHITIPKLQETAKKTTATSVAPRPKPQPSAATPAAAPAPVKANPPSMDLLSLDSPAPVVSQPQPQPAQQSTSLADELIDFGAFQGGPQTLSPTTTSQPQQQQQQQLASLSQNTAPINNEESLLKDDTATSKSTKDSIMALFGAGGASSSHQQQIYGVPGGMYISPQQQTTPHNMMNGPRMQTGLYHQQHHQQHHHQQHQHRQPLHQGPHHQGPHQPHRQPHHFMQQQHGLMHHAPPHQQHAQLSQIQNQMQNMKLHKTPQINQAQQPNQYNMYNTNQTMFNQQAMNSLMTNQHMMNYQQQQPKFVSTGPVNNAYPVGAMPSTGHTFNNQLWK